MRKEHTMELKEITTENFDKLVIQPYNQEDMVSHRHHFFELVYVTGGSALHLLNGKNTSLKKGDYFIVDYGSQHSYMESNQLTIINCLFLPEIVEDTLKGCCSFEVLMKQCLLRYYKFHPHPAISDCIFHDEDEMVYKLLTGIQKEYQEKQIAYNEVFRLRLIEILILTMRKIVGNHTITQNTFSMAVIQYVDIHYKEQKILYKFCTEYHFSPPYVSRKFKQETGMTIIMYLQKVRIEKSCELLAGSDKSIMDIAQDVGYGDVKFFNQIFRRLLQMTPGEYRKMSLLYRTSHE